MKKDAKMVFATVMLCLALVALLTLLLPSTPDAKPQEEPQPQRVLTLVYAFQNSKWNSCVEELVRRFEEQHPDIDVQCDIRYENRVYEDALNMLAARDQLGDIMQIKEPYGWAENGLLAPIPEELAAVAKPSCVVEGTCYGLCALGTTTGVVYNKAIFRDLGISEPSDYNEFIDLCETIKSAGISPLGMGGEDLWHLEYWLNHFLRSDVLSREPDFLALCSSGERDWRDPLISEMFLHLEELFRREYVDGSWPATPDTALAYHLSSGNIAMVFSGPWLALEAQELEPELELGWFYVPNTQGDTIAGESLDVFWTITADCAEDPQRYADARAFLEFFYSESIYDEIYSAMAGFSTIVDAGQEASAGSPIMDEVHGDRATADKHISAYVGDENTPPGFEKKLLTALLRMYSGELSAAELQELACQYWEECLEAEVGYED